MIVRLIIFVVLAALAVAVAKRVRARLGAERPTQVHGETRRCAYCDTFFPAGEAVVREQRTYCSSAHAELALQDHE
ncbi:MAG: PP0621 family protein [Pseudomonadota bacterium]